ncbi:MAG: FAD binding domain-containing protein [Acidobacteria bacterium]|nr:FAD binding domain-containing protein [Acidobacteriota bacterium]
MQPTTFILNDKQVVASGPQSAPLLDYLRESARLCGTKIGCREGDCGACTVLVGRIVNGDLSYRSFTSCLMPIGRAQGCHVVTIEGIRGAELTPVQRAMVEQSASQCGFCTPGFVMSMTAFALEGRRESDLRTVVDGNICRCTGYKSIERALAKLSDNLNGAPNTPDRLTWLIEHGYVPGYFKEVADRLRELNAEPVAGSGTVVLSGGTDLNVQRPESMLSETPIWPALPTTDDPFVVADGYVSCPGSASMEQLRLSSTVSQLIPNINEYLRLVASTPVRSLASIAGNLANASPIGDTTIMLLALGAELDLGEGWLPLDEFYLGYKQTARRPDQIIECIRFPVPSPYFHFEKVSKRTHLDIASVNTAMHIRVQESVITSARLSAGGVAPIPLFLRHTSSQLIGLTVNAETASWAAQMASDEAQPISDIRGSAEYKRMLLERLVLAHFISLFPSIEAEVAVS